MQVRREKGKRVELNNRAFYTVEKRICVKEYERAKEVSDIGEKVYKQLKRIEKFDYKHMDMRDKQLKVDFIVFYELVDNEGYAWREIYFVSTVTRLVKDFERIDKWEWI